MSESNPFEWCDWLQFATRNRDERDEEDEDDADAGDLEGRLDELLRRMVAPRVPN